MATPESGGYLEPDAFKDAMATLGPEPRGKGPEKRAPNPVAPTAVPVRAPGLDESSSKSLADQLLSAISSGKQVVLRRLVNTNPEAEECLWKGPSVDLSFDGLWDKLGREEDAASAWKKATQAAVSKYLDSKGPYCCISKDCQVIQTEHPYPATSHSWTKDLKIPGTKGMKQLGMGKRVGILEIPNTEASRSEARGISKPSVGPGMRVEASWRQLFPKVEGKDGLRRFGSVVEVVAEEKGGRLVRLDYMGTAVFNKYDQVEVQKCAGDDDSWDTYPEDQIRLVAATTPNCPDCASEMLWADHQTGGYAFGWTCNECGEGQLQTELGWFRWCCKECCNDYCSRCWPEKRPEGEEAPPVKKDSKKNMPASDEFAFVVDNFERLKVTYNLKEELPGSEIETFTVDYDQPLAPVGLKFFKDKKGAAQREGLKEWWRVDLFNTLLGESQSLFADLQGDFGGDPPQTAEDISKNLEGNVRRLQAALSKTDWGEEESVVFEFINGMSHRLVPEAHITFTGKKVGDEIKAFEAREIGNDPVISDLDAGLAYTAGVRKGWVLSLSDTLGAENTGKRPPITMEELQSSPEAVNKLLEMQDVTLVFECLAPDPTDNAQFCGEGFEDLDVDVNEASVEFKTDGDGGGFPDRRWGVLCLVVPSDAVPQGGAGQRFRWHWKQGQSTSVVPSRLKDAGQYLEYKEDEPDQEILISEEALEATSEGKTFLKLADGRGWVRLQQTYDGDEMDSLERVSPWAEVMSGAAEVMKRAEGFGNGTPVVSREGWDEERLRALCARHGWEFEWMSEDGERRRRGAERQSMVALPAVSGTSDTHCRQLRLSDIRGMLFHKWHSGWFEANRQEKKLDRLVENGGI
ncbi:unnamed protein product [Effrenium voratum]|nr:unnamed protein product [Effrenium voratum]